MSGWSRKLLFIYQTAILLARLMHLRTDMVTEAYPWPDNTGSIKLWLLKEPANGSKIREYKFCKFILFTHFLACRGICRVCFFKKIKKGNYEAAVKVSPIFIHIQHL